MLVLLSPAKTFDIRHLDLNQEISALCSNPVFLTESLVLATILKKYQVTDIADLMGLSNKLAELNFKRYQDYSLEHNLQNSKPAIFAYKGDVYKPLMVDKYNANQLAHADKSIRIISGLYGILKPLDLIKEYRLEMSTSLANEKGGNLYNFWQEKITNNLNQETPQVLINLASVEYSSAVNYKQLKHKVIDITFMESQNGQNKIIGIHAKKARGTMANYIISNLIEDSELLKDFDLLGYEFNFKLSSEREYVFIR